MVQDALDHEYWRAGLAVEAMEIAAGPVAYIAGKLFIASPAGKFVEEKAQEGANWLAGKLRPYADPEHVFGAASAALFLGALPFGIKKGLEFTREFRAAGALRFARPGPVAAETRSLSPTHFEPGRPQIEGPVRPGQAAEEAGTIRTVNTIGGDMNCVNCVIATDATLAGRPASALGGGPFRLNVLEKFYGTKFGPATTIDNISSIMGEAGAGSRGIVFGSRGSDVGHVFNVANQRGVVRFLDGQTGKAATFDGFDHFRLLRTGK